MAPFASVDAYLAAMPERTRRILKRVREVLRKALPKSSDGISYNIPVITNDDMMVVYFAGHKAHYAIYPSTPALLEHLGNELKPRLKSRSIHFSYDEPVPTRLITRIAKVRAAEAAELAAARKAKKKANAGTMSSAARAKLAAKKKTKVAPKKR